MTDTVRTAFPDRKRIHIEGSRILTVRKQFRDKRSASLKRLLQTIDEIRETVVEAGKRTEIQDRDLFSDFIAVFVFNADRLDESEIETAIVSKTFDVHTSTSGE